MSLDLSPAPTPKSDMVGLHVHTSGSFLDGWAKVKDLPRRAKVLGQEAVAITDHQEVGNHLAFYKACLEENVKPVLGMEGYFVDSVDRVRSEKDSKNSHITLLAQNNKGLRNLWAWSTEAYEDKFYYRALQDWEGMRQYSEGLYASDGCMLAYMARAILAEDETQCHELLSRYTEIFGDRFYMELHTWQFMEAQDDEQRKLNADMTAINKGKVALAEQWGIPLVVVNDAHYAEAEEWTKHDMVWQMSTGKNSDQTARGQTAAHMMGDDELVYWMERHGINRSVTEEAIKNSGIIAADCNVSIEPVSRMPRITESAEADRELFVKTLEEGYERKVVNSPKPKEAQVYWDRMVYEAKLILGKEFDGYFNVVADLVKDAKYGRKNAFKALQVATRRAGMLLGPGRGSAAGSVCCWFMDITELDPLKYGLPFERFINPDRSGYPDIDLDFPQSKRKGVKQAIEDRFGGPEHVVTIGTTQTLQPLGILQKLSSIYDVPWADRTAMSKIFGKAKSNDPEKSSMTWDEIMEQLEEPLAPYVSQFPEMFQYMGEMVGMVRGSATHASGVLISTEPLMGIMPIRVTREDEEGNKEASRTSAFTMKEVEWLGFIKFDILGLKHLDIIEKTLDLIYERDGKDIDVYTFDDAEYADPAIWPEIWAGDTTGIFQLNTPDMTRVAKRFIPHNEYEVADLISVNRPGVIYAKQLDPYLDRRAGLIPPSYHNPETEKWLSRTFGVLVYQEQIMDIVKDLAGFTPGRADMVRSAVSKKKQAELDAFHVEFVDGCLANQAFVEGSETGDARADAENIWRSIKSSGSYAFSLNHAQAYSLISCWEVWLRHYYYEKFITACLVIDGRSKKKGEPPKSVLYLRHARMRGVEILVPDINESEGDFTLTDRGIRYGLNFIKGIGESTTAKFLGERPFASFDDFLSRTNVNRGAVTSLIRIGAFDSLKDRTALYARYREILTKGHKEMGIKKIVKQARDKLEAEPYPDLVTREGIYETEKELTGSFITSDPMEPYLKMISKNCIASPEEVEELDTNETCIIGGQITKIKEITTKKGSQMAFIAVEYNYQTFDITVFPSDWQRYKWALEMEKPVAVAVTRDDRGVHMNQMERLDLMLEKEN